MTQQTTDDRRPVPSLSSAFGSRPRRVAPAHPQPPRPEPVAPNGLKMSRELTGLLSGFDEELAAVLTRHKEGLGKFASDIAIRERTANVAQGALREAIDGSRNNEEARMLRQENERQHQTILTLQRELAVLRREEREELGDANPRYFRALGRDLSEAATDMEVMSESLLALADNKERDDAMLRSVAQRLGSLAQDLGEFAENAEAYSTESSARVMSAAAGD